MTSHPEKGRDEREVRAWHPVGCTRETRTPPWEAAMAASEADTPNSPRPQGKRKRIVLTTIGSLGDLHPYIAIALGLKARGHQAVVATGECYRKKVEALGLGFHPLRPDSTFVADPVAMRRIMN